MKVAQLKTRGILKVEGAEAQPFLQKLCTQDLNLLSESQALYGAFLTPQGRYFADFFICQQQDTLYLEIAKERLQSLMEWLTRYRMRFKCSIQDISHLYRSFSIWEINTTINVFGLLHKSGMCCQIEGGFAFVDPRLESLGLRVFTTHADVPPLQNPIPEETYTLFRTTLGISEAPQDLIPGKSIILENGLAYLNGISWTKGCYPGQELMARTFHRGQIHKRTFPVRIIGPTPPLNAPIFQNDKVVGKMLSHVENQGMARLSVESVCAHNTHGTALIVSDKTYLKPSIPSWMHLSGKPPANHLSHKHENDRV